MGHAEIMLSAWAMQKCRISEWAEFQVWKFFHPKDWKNLQKLAHGANFKG